MDSQSLPSGNSISDSKDSRAEYACDACRTRKNACSRDLPVCQYCLSTSRECIYSRSGIIRRNRKRKHVGHMYEEGFARSAIPIDGGEAHKTSPATSISSALTVVPRADSEGLQSHLAADIEVTRDRFRGFGNAQDSTLGALSSLSETCAAVWHDEPVVETSSKTFFVFREHAVAWTQLMVDTLERGQPLTPTTPLPVLDELRACQPGRVRERAWLVIFYSIALSAVSSKTPEDQSTKAKLRCNIWLALNDARLLLEPSETNIHALVTLATHVEEFTTPSLCWMLTANACRMLQALGINHSRLDPTTRERRRRLFWHLNMLDKGLALIFARPPTFHRAMSKEVEIPTLDSLLPFRPHAASGGVPATFGAHFLHQILQFTVVLEDIWYHLNDEPSPGLRAISEVKRKLESWYHQALKILESAALVEKPFVLLASAISIELGLSMIKFQYQYMIILLTRSSEEMRPQCIAASKIMLQLLDDMVSDSEEPFNGIIWQLVCSPFTPFLILFRELLTGVHQTEETQNMLTAMQCLPEFLQKMSVRNSLATKLTRVAVVIVQHAELVLKVSQPPGGTPKTHRLSVEKCGIDEQTAMGSGIVDASLSSHAPMQGMQDWDTFFQHAISSQNSIEMIPNAFTSQLQVVESWSDEILGDPTLDWIAMNGLL